MSLNELKQLVAETNDRTIWQGVLDHVVQVRKTRAARLYETELRAKFGQASGSASAARPPPAPPGAPRRHQQSTVQEQLPLVRERTRPRARAQTGGASFPPTAQQQDAVDAFMSGGSLKISAFAGAGKTSTLKLMARAREGRGLYLAFNSRTAEEASGDFPADVDCRTTHSFARRAVQSRYRFPNQQMFGKIGAMQLASVMNLQPLKLDNVVTLTPPQQAFLFLATVRKFCQSSDGAIAATHVLTTPRLLGLKPETQASVRSWVESEAQTLWGRMANAADEMPLGHDGYLKLWALDHPILDYEYVLLDEAQDTNPVVLSVLKEQNTQMVYVGDRHQQIYEWRGAINAMEEIETERETALTQSFRFGPAIASAATAVLRALGEARSVEGNTQRESRISAAGTADAILARTNAAVIKETLAAIDAGKRPLIVGGTKELKRLVGDVFQLMRGEPGSHPDFFGFKNWDEVVAFAETDEGESLRPFVMLVQANNGPGKLYAAINGSETDPEKANLSISTAHKAKGSEWDTVELANDFSASLSEDQPIPISEARLFYVAMTRAKRTLIVEPSLLEAFTGARRFTTADRARRSRPYAQPEGVRAPRASPTPNVDLSQEWPAGMF
jgi:hypothetical protein